MSDYMSGNYALELKWSKRLQSGKRVKLCSGWLLWGFTLFCTGVVLYALWVLFGNYLLAALGKEPFSSPKSISISLAFFFVLPRLWGSLLFQSIRFSDNSLEIWNGWNKLIFIKLEDIVALELDFTRGRRFVNKMLLCSSQASSSDNFQWSIIAPLFWNLGLMKAFKNELIQRCNLIEACPSDSQHIAELWRRKGEDFELPISPEKLKTHSEAVLQERLKTGKIVKPYRITSLHVMLALGSLFLLFGIIFIPWSPEDKMGRYLAIPFFFFWFFLTFYFWSQLLRSSIQFTDSTLIYWDWCGRKRQIALTDIVAASTHLSGRPVMFVINLCHLTPGQGGGATWFKLFSGRIQIGEIIVEELTHRCEMKDTAAEDEDNGMWQKPGHEADIPPLKWWMRM